VVSHRHTSLSTGRDGLRQSFRVSTAPRFPLDGASERPGTYRLCARKVTHPRLQPATTHVSNLEMYAYRHVPCPRKCRDAGIPPRGEELADGDGEAEQMSGNPHGTFTIYDQAYPLSVPNTSTPARAAAVTFENAVRVDSSENGAFFASDGSEVVRKTGVPDRVRFIGQELNGTYGTLFTHNHPNNNTFSAFDVLAAIKSNVVELRAVGPTIRYRMWAPSGWPTQSELHHALTTEVARANQRTAMMVAAGSVHRRFAQMEAEHQCWVLVAGALGLQYRREKS
jgi:hypothetical protein